MDFIYNTLHGSSSNSKSSLDKIARARIDRKRSIYVRETAQGEKTK